MTLLQRAGAAGLLDDLLCDLCGAGADTKSIDDRGDHLTYSCAGANCIHVSMLDEVLITEAEREE